LALITLCTIFGNGFIMAVVFSHRHLRRPAHLFIASLASTDLLLGLTVMTPRLIKELAGKWIFGFTLCQVKTTNVFFVNQKFSFNKKFKIQKNIFRNVRQKKLMRIF
jgi:hypothetical protein